MALLLDGFARALDQAPEERVQLRERLLVASGDLLAAQLDAQRRR